MRVDPQMRVVRGIVGPASLCRMDADLVARIARGERLGELALGAILVIVAGAGAYGIAFGIWRAPEQALYACVKLPLLVLLVVAASTCANAMIALLLRARIGARQSAVCILLGLATSAAILGALSPVSIFLALSVPPPDPTVLGLTLDDPRADQANGAAQSLLLYHVAVIAIAGVLGNLRLFALLRRLSGDRAVALRVLVAWLGTELFVGSELSWLMRPFLARPHLEPRFFAEEPLDGSFFEEVGLALARSVGAPGLVLAGAFVAVALVAFVRSMRSDGLRAELEPGPQGVSVATDDLRLVVPWERVVRASCRASVVLFEDVHEVVLDVTSGPAPRLIARFADRDEAEALHARIEALRVRSAGAGPYRSARALPAG